MYQQHRGQRGPRYTARPHTRRRARSMRGQFCDVSKFINRAAPIVEAAPFVAQHSFSDFAIDERVKKNVAMAGYTTPTPIQDQAIPQILLGCDLVGIANTGTGKTAAFLLPLIDKILKNRREQVLIMAPTRELAIQIDQEFRKFAFGLSIFSVCAVGGMPIFRQMNDLRRSHNVVIGTPGRLKDLLEHRALRLDDVANVVLDEADRMLDMGFINDMRLLLGVLPQNRQTLFFSATLSYDIKNIINEFLHDPVSISVKTSDTARAVDQDVIYVKADTKIDLLHDLLLKPECSKVLIFGRTKYGVEKLSSVLVARGFKAGSIHGNKNHTQRQRALAQFKDDRSQILVATDVAARGLDIPNVSHVINYELPATYEDYIHRIGRTGRAGKAGKALTFVEEKGVR